MSVYVDRGAIAYRGMKMCHMIADTLDELHAMADALGLARRWFQAAPPASFPHYDIAKSKRSLAIQLGAIDCERNDFVGHMRRLRPVFGVYGPGNPAPRGWTGPREGELAHDDKLLVDLPPERWPFCLPEEHDVGCMLRDRNGARGSYCDCSASAEDE